MAKSCNRERFYDVCDDLKKAGNKFSLKSMQRLCYGDLMLAVIGNDRDPTKSSGRTS